MAPGARHGSTRCRVTAQMPGEQRKGKPCLISLRCWTATRPSPVLTPAARDPASVHPAAEPVHDHVHRPQGRSCADLRDHAGRRHSAAERRRPGNPGRPAGHRVHRLPGRVQGTTGPVLRGGHRSSHRLRVNAAGRRRAPPRLRPADQHRRENPQRNARPGPSPLVATTSRGVWDQAVPADVRASGHVYDVETGLVTTVVEAKSKK